MKQGITILFGAGAECTDEYKLPSGVGFTKLLISNDKELEEAKKAFYGENKNLGFKIFNSHSKHIFTQTITTSFKDSSELPKWISLEEYTQCRKYEGYDTLDDNTSDFINTLCKKYYKIVNDYDFSKKADEKNQSNEDMIANFFADKCVLFETLDSKFNLLREYDENKISAKAKRVKDAYITLFLGLVKHLYEPTDYSLKNILNVVSSNDYVCKIPEGVTYYNIVKDTIAKTDRHIRIHLATTNYTECLYRETNAEDIIYLHGKLNYFEDLKHLVLYDAKNENDKELILKNQKYIIPYILIPSGVKPLICKEQIEAFSNFLSSLNDSNYLFVLGYNLNSEDNHINSLIASWLKENKDNKMIYFSFKSKKPEMENKKSFLEKNTWLEGFNEQIIFLLIDENNCYDLFKENLYTYIQKTKEGRKI